MSLRRGARHFVKDQRGVMLVTTALLIPVFILFVAFVMATADWYVHKRHLQTQADAAALAAASDIAFPCSAATLTKINATVTKYGATLNPQVESSPSNIHLVVNKPTYYNQSTADDTPDADPCAAKMVDVKATETDLRDILGAGIVPNINAHARVELFQAAEITGSLPLAVPEPAPKHVRAFLVDETTGTTLASANLDKNGTDSNGNNVWDSGGDTLSVTVGSRDRMGLRIALSGQTSTTCGDPLVACYDYDAGAGTDSAPAQKGLVFVHGYEAAASGQQPGPPKVHSATLTSTSCPDPYFSVATSCNVALHADVDFGVGINDPRKAASAGGVGAILTATVGNATYPLSWSSGQTWDTTETIPVGAGSGPVPIQLSWEEQAGTVGADTCKPSGNKCKGSFGTVQRSFSGNDARSGPIQLLQIMKGGVAGANSLRQCDAQNAACTYSLGVRVAIQGTLATAQTINDPKVILRTADQNQSQLLDCDPALTDRQEIVQGCGKRYTLNTGTVCPKSGVLWGSPQPWQCVAIQTGAKTNPVPAGLNERILGDPKASSCTRPDGWGPNFYKAQFGAWDHADPRIVQLLLTPFGSFNGQGSDSTVPVVNFGTFYVTGWAGQGSGFDNPCETTDVPSDPLLRDEAAGGAGNIVGHFISYPPPDGIPSPTQCDPTVITTCVPVLTR